MEIIVKTSGKKSIYVQEALMGVKQKYGESLSIGVDVESLNEQQLKEYNTKDKVFLASKIKLIQLLDSQAGEWWSDEFIFEYIKQPPVSIAIIITIAIICYGIWLCYG